MFKGFFSKEEDEVEEYKETIDPVVEKRRKEKFSKPLIYEEDFTLAQEKESPSEPLKEDLKKETVEPPIKKSNYTFSSITSPMFGKSDSSHEVKQEKAKPIRKTKPKDQLVPLISPFYGIKDEEESNEVEPIVLQKVTSVSTEDNNKDISTKNIDDTNVNILDFFEQEKKSEVKVETKEVKDEKEEINDNIRNIARIIEDNQDEFKIIEDRTGEFKLDFSNENKQQSSLIDEIDDNMSLDELMNLYDKKFTD